MPRVTPFAFSLLWVLPASSAPMPLPRREGEPPIRWTLDGRKKLTVDDYLARQRIMGQSGQTSLGKEADAFWRGVVAHYDRW